MSTKPDLVWKCPICGSVHSSDWRLSAHIGAMAVVYKESHREWALTRDPDVEEAESPGEAASMLRRFVVDEVEPHEPPSSPQHRDLDLLSNLSQGYMLVATMELRLHNFVLQKLRVEHGDQDWRKQVPQSVRKACSDRYEMDDNRYKWEQYLYLIDLKDIIEKRWHLFQIHAERLDKFPGKAQLIKYLEELNRLRNQIMHPLKRKPLGQEDFEFLSEFSRRLEQFCE